MIRGLQGPLTGVERAGLILGLALAAVLMIPVRHHVTDGTFIHLQHARHLAAGSGLVFNLEDRVYGSVSPLWVALIADGILLGFDGLAVARALGVAATLASVGLFFQLMRRTLRMPALRAFATLAWASHAWMLEWSQSGLETPLAVALLLAGFVAYTEGKEWGSRPIRTGALWGLAALLRPEAVFLLLLWTVLMLIDTQDREGLRRLVLGLLPAAAIYGGWLAFARFYFGTFWPQALSVDAGGARGVPDQLGRLTHELGVILMGDGILCVLLIVGLILGARGLKRDDASARHLLPWLWVVALPLLYAARGVEPHSRHLLLISPVLAWLAWSTAEAWWIGPPGGERRPVQAAVLGMLAMMLVIGENLFVYGTRVVPEVRRNTALIEQVLAPWGRWFHRNTAAGDAIATAEIGTIGYYSGRRIVDLTGLVTPGMLPLLARHSHDEIVRGFRFERFGRPRYLVDRTWRGPESPNARALQRLGTAGPRSVYRVDWRHLDERRRVR